MARLDPMRAKIAVQMSWHRCIYVMARPRLRRGRLFPGHPHQHGAADRGPGQSLPLRRRGPGHDGKEGDFHPLNELNLARMGLDPAISRGTELEAGAV